ncbi:MAG: hypothetical protein IKW51_08705 [Bacteroidales bacterium]|nr:hypothetical protein [Bacteroidales bacterium]
MKTEKEIREKLNELYALRETDNYRCDFGIERAVEHKISMLEWVLKNN